MCTKRFLQMNYSLNSLKGVVSGNIWGSIVGVIKRETWSIDYGGGGGGGGGRGGGYISI